MHTIDAGEDLDPKTGEEHAVVRRQLERVLAHSSFKNSRRYQAFLRYVVEEKLQGNSLHLKERMIGVSVFHQPLNYDTNANSVVRVTAGEIRRRLAQYYLEANQEDEIIIELPLGSYVPEFRAADAAPERETVPPELERQFPSAIEESGKPEIEILLLEEPPAPPPSRTWHPALIAVFAFACLLAISLVVAFTAHGGASTESDRIWQGAFGHQNVLICAGVLDSGFSITTARTVTIISAAIGHAGGSAFLLPQQDAKFEDLQRSPVVLIGTFNNEWTTKLQSTLRYQLFRSADGNISGILDTKNPDSKRFMIDKNRPDQNTRDYGLIAHFQSPTTGQSTVIASGIAMHGTAAVRLFFSSPELLRDFAKSAPGGWEKRNYEIILASDSVNKLADAPKVVDAYFW